jgi:putative inorganic carbon (hco3(-)) transporter
MGLRLPFLTVLACAVVFLLEGNRFRRWTLGDTLLALFSLVILASSAQAYLPSKSFSELSLFFGWVLIYFLITNIVNTEGRFFVFMLLYLLYCVKMTQHGVRGWADAGFAFRDWGVTCAPSWFQNSGECGIQMLMVFSVSLLFAVSLRRYWNPKLFWAFFLILPLGAMITMVASSSRGAIIGLAGVAPWMVLKSRHRVRALAALILLAGTIWVLLPPEQKARFAEMGEDGTSVDRKTYWKDGMQILGDYPVLGIGYKNWLPYYRTYYNNAFGQLPHNIFIEAGAELGYLGLTAFAALIVGTLVLNYRTRQTAARIPAPGGGFLHAMAHGLDAAMIGYLIAGFFVTVLYYPFFWINFSMTVALSCVARGRALRSGAAIPRPTRTGPWRQRLPRGSAG